MPVIRMIGNDTAATLLADSLGFVDGPLDGSRRSVDDPPATIAADGGAYRRSVHCADDGAIRYVFEADPDPSEASGDG